MSKLPTQTINEKVAPVVNHFWNSVADPVSVPLETLHEIIQLEVSLQFSSHDSVVQQQMNDLWGPEGIYLAEFDRLWRERITEDRQSS